MDRLKRVCFTKINISFLNFFLKVQYTFAIHVNESKNSL